MILLTLESRQQKPRIQTESSTGDRQAALAEWHLACTTCVVVDEELNSKNNFTLVHKTCPRQGHQRQWQPKGSFEKMSMSLFDQPLFTLIFLLLLVPIVLILVQIVLSVLFGSRSSSSASHQPSSSSWLSKDW